ncbi:MAG: GDP-mannose 4,6-dehydratase, partial [Oscillospiraceae bacterium]|nr:GDP-mannose 4,6-dehydratase [Oscillospiraceae bacterium]
MKTYLITGGAGFIGANMVLYLLGKYTDIRIINLDALTYAGNMENLQQAEGDGRHVFVHGDIGDKALVARLLREHDPDCVIHFAAESHVDRSIAEPMIFVDTNVRGTV